MFSKFFFKFVLAGRLALAFLAVAPLGACYAYPAGYAQYGYPAGVYQGYPYYGGYEGGVFIGGPDYGRGRPGYFDDGRRGGDDRGFHDRPAGGFSRPDTRPGGAGGAGHGGGGFHGGGGGFFSHH